MLLDKDLERALRDMLATRQDRVRAEAALIACREKEARAAETLREITMRQLNHAPARGGALVSLRIRGVRLRVVRFDDRRSKALLAAGNAIAQAQADQALEERWRARVAANIARRRGART